MPRPGNPHRNFRSLPASTDVLPAGQRRLVTATILALHGVAGWAVLQVPAVRDAMTEAAPLFVSWIAPPVPPERPIAPPPPPPPQARPTPKAPPPLPIISAAPTPAPAPFVVAAVVEVPEIPVPTAPPVVEAVPAPAPTPAPPTPPAPAPAPKTIPASAVQYLEPPLLEYPRLSRRARESGRVMVRVYIDEAGLPRTVQLSQSSGHARLDDAAVAAVQKARFKPYTEDGRPTPGWAFIPLDFDLEK